MRKAYGGKDVLRIEFGIAAIAAMLRVVGQTNRAAERNAAAADLVIGTKATGVWPRLKPTPMSGAARDQPGVGTGSMRHAAAAPLKPCSRPGAARCPERS